MAQFYFPDTSGKRFAPLTPYFCAELIQEKTTLLVKLKGHENEYRRLQVKATNVT